MKSLILAMAASGVLLLAQNTPSQRTESQGTNQGSTVAMNDSAVTAKVRQALLNDANLAPHAGNVRVATHRNVVMLRGKVDSREEKDSIVAKVRQVAGDSNVKDDLSVSK